MLNQEILIFQLMAKIDEQLAHQLQLILHHPEFQTLESAWRGLRMLAQKIKKNDRLILKCFSLSKKELCEDLLDSIDFDHSILFKKIYTEELDYPGGQPFGLLVGDFYFAHRADEFCHDPISVLRSLAHIGQVALVPFVLGLDSRLLGLNSFSEWEPTQIVSELYLQEEYQRWNRFRKEEVSRFVGFAMPRILMRSLYDHRFFQEIAEKHQDYLWGNASFAYAGVVMSLFLAEGWFSNLRGLPYQSACCSYFECDEIQLIAKPATEVLITDQQERDLGAMGMMALRDYSLFESQVFFSSQSLYAKPFMLHYLLCLARFGHYIKVMMRNKVGLFLQEEFCEQFLQSWLNTYCVDSSASEAMKAKCPLQMASVRVQGDVGVGRYRCRVHLKPHDQFDFMESDLVFITSV